MKILILIVIFTMSSATIHRLFKPSRLYKKLVKPFVGFALKHSSSHGDFDDIEPLGHFEEDHSGQKSKHHHNHHRKHKEIVIYHHVPHYQHMEPFIHGQPFHSSHQPFHYGFQSFPSGHHHGHGHVHVHSTPHEPVFEGALYGGTIGFHDEVVGHEGEPSYHHGGGSFGFDKSLHHKGEFYGAF